MSTQELTIRPVVGSSLHEIQALGNVFKQSGYFKDIRDEAQAVTKILYGREMGFTPIISIMGIYIVDGKPSLSSNLLATLVKRSGKYDYRIKENSNDRCAILFRQRDDQGKWEDLGETEFTIKDAQTAKVASKDVWQRYPKAMLFSRCLSAGVRAHCPDVSICPIYVPEELGMDVNEENEITKPVEVQAVREEKKSLSFKRESAAPNSGQDAQPQKGASTSDAADNHSTATIEREGHPEAESSTATASVAVGSAEVEELISIGQQKNFHKECRAAVRPAMSMQADNLTYKWLQDNKYLDDNGLPTAAAIPAAIYLEERRKACAWLKVQ